MTRINLILPSELSDQHLLAEHRELKRIPNNIANGKCRIENIPSEYRLGKGHVKFFYDKLIFLYHRYLSLYRECKKRGFNVEYYIAAFNSIDKDKYGHLFNDWHPSEIEIQRSKQRIKEKLESNPDFYRWTNENENNIL